MKIVAFTICWWHIVDTYLWYWFRSGWNLKWLIMFAINYILSHYRLLYNDLWRSWYKDCLYSMLMPCNNWNRLIYVYILFLGFEISSFFLQFSFLLALISMPALDEWQSFQITIHVLRVFYFPYWLFLRYWPCIRSIILRHCLSILSGWWA
jgi:hypothetical protein